MFQELTSEEARPGDVEADRSERFWRSIAPWSPNNLMKDWERLRQRGCSGFILRYGLLRITPPLAAPAVVLMIHSDASGSLARWMFLLAMYIAFGVIWGVITWKTCESRWAQGMADELTKQ